MRRKSILLLLLLLCGMCLSAADYVMLSGLDSTALPPIARRDCGSGLIRSVLQGDLVWESSHKKLVRHDFSAKVLTRVMKNLYMHTHRHMVGIRCAYWSETPAGDSLLVSGKIYLPKNRQLKGIVVANHYTIATDMEAPSNLFQMDCIYALKGYAVVMPDYVGYGLSRDEVHPYLHWRSAARTAIDLLDCMPALLEYYGYSYPNDVVITGYSQGGAVALGVARMLEENPDSQWTIRQVYAGAGPYDPAATYDYCVARDSIGIPGAIPMIVMGLSEAYGLDFQLEDFFREPLLSHYDQWVASKQYTVGQIGQMMGSGRMSVLMPAEVLDRNNALTKQLYDALLDNSNIGYELHAPAYFMHSTVDDVVPFINSQSLQEHMPASAQVEYDFDDYGSHMEGAIPFVKKVYQRL